MLGKQIGEERGKVTGRRVLPSEGQGPKMEITFEAGGKFAGVDATDVGTYWTAVQANGALYGEGEGLITTTQGQIVQWVGAGRGRFTKQGGVSFRGAVYYRTTSTKLAHLNEVAVIYEHETDREGNVTTKYWEWK